jgi:polysaccharide deacetylase 2 family uncharacterized protein YibQ
MRKRSLDSRSAGFIAIAIVIMVALDFIFFPLHKSPPNQDKPVVIQAEPALDQSAVVADHEVEESEDEYEGPHKPDFAPPLAMELTSPLLPDTVYEKEEEKIEPPWIRNAVTSNAPEDRPRVAIIIDDMGMDRKHTKAAIDLPAPLTMAFLPYAGDLKSQTEAARAKGHELLVHVPMEPMNGALDAGPAVLKAGETPEEFMATLDKDLSAFDGYVGINNHMGSKMTQDRAGMRRLMAELKKRGLLFIDSRTINNSVAADEAAKAHIPYAVRNVFLDNDETSEAVEGALQQVEKRALKNGLAIAIGHPREETINALRAWIPTLKEKGISLIPVSEAVIVPDGANEDATLR